MSNQTLWSLAQNLTTNEWQQFSCQLGLREVKEDCDFKVDCFQILIEMRGECPHSDQVRRMRRALESCQKPHYSEALKRALATNQHVDFSKFDPDGNYYGGTAPTRKPHGKLLDNVKANTVSQSTPLSNDVIEEETSSED